MKIVYMGKSVPKGNSCTGFLFSDNKLKDGLQMEVLGY